MSVVARNPQLIDLFVTDTKGHVLTNWFSPDPQSRWHDWFAITNGIAEPAAPGAPVSVVARNPGQMDLFTTDLKGQVLTNWFNPDPQSRWHNWFAIINGNPQPATPSATIAAVSRYANQMDLFAPDHGGSVDSNWWHDSLAWATWFDCEVRSTIGPACGDPCESGVARQVRARRRDGREVAARVR